MKRLYATTDPIEAEVIRALLRDRGIESEAENEGSAAYAVGLPTAAVPIGINVSDQDAPAAAEALAKHFEKSDEGMEADPEAPPPPAPEEAARFEEKARRRSFGRRFLLLLAFVGPTVLGIAISFGPTWPAAVVAAGGLLSLVALVWVLDVVAEKKDPPP